MLMLVSVDVRCYFSELINQNLEIMVVTIDKFIFSFADKTKT